LFDEFSGQCYGNVTVVDEKEVPTDYTLVVPDNASLSVPENSTFIFNGTINNNGIIRDNDGTLVLNGILNGNKILFSNYGNKTDTILFPSLPIDIDFLFKINPNAGTPIHFIEEGSTGEGILNNDFLTVEKIGTFIIGLVTAETYYYTESDKVTSVLVVVPIIGIENYSSDKLTAFTNSSRLYVKGLQEGKIWSVYNTMGALIYRGVARDVKEDIPLLTKGIFIVHSEGQSIKVIHN
jgi:hypothetical protein